MVRLSILISAVLAFVGIATVPALAQTAASKPLKIIVPNPPGGAADIVVRHLQPPLAEVLGQTVIVENKPGANGIIGMEAMLRSPPDGSVLATAASSIVSSPALYSSLPYDVLKDIRPVTILTRAPNVLSVPPSSAYKSFGDILEAAKRTPGKLIVATSGNGTAQHFSLEEIKILTGTDIVHVAYKGAGPAFNDLVAAQVGIGLLNIAGTMPFVRSGQLRPLAVTSLKRSAQLPDVPSISETLPGFDMSEFFALVASAAVPADTIERLYAAVVKAARTPGFEAKVREAGMELDLLTPTEFRALMLVEHKRLGDLARKAGIRLD